MKTFYTIRMDDKELIGRYYDINKAIAEIREWQSYPANARKTFHLMQVKEIIKGNITYIPSEVRYE
jgi:hypothetical protein